MSSRQIGIQIMEGGVTAVQAADAEGGYRLEKAVHLPMQRSSDTLKECLRRLTEEEGFDRKAGMCVAIPYRESIYIRGEWDGSEAAADDFPVAGRGALALKQRFVNPEHQRMETLVSAAPAELAEQRLDEMRGGKSRCEYMDTAGAAIAAAAREKCEEIGTDIFIAVHSDTSHIVIVIGKEEKLFCVRNLIQPDFGAENAEESSQRDRFLVREMELTWRSVLSERMAENTPVVLMGELNRQSGLMELIRSQLGARIMDYETNAEEKRGEAPEGYDVALGMAIRGLHGTDREDGNFVRLVKEKSRRHAEQQRGVRAPMILAVLTAVLLGTGIMVRWIRLEREYAAIKGEIRQTFERVLPDETNIVDEAAQLDQRVKDTESVLARVAPWGTNGTDAFGALQNIAGCLPSGVSLDSIAAGREGIRIQVRGETLEAIQGWQMRLKGIGMFSGVEVRQVQKGADGVQCEMILAVKEN